MGEMADDFLDDVMDMEDARLDHMMGDMDDEEALDRGIIDEHGFSIDANAEEEEEEEETMKTFYVTFGLGSILRKSYLIAYATDEVWLRLALNKTKLPWCSCHNKKESLGIEEYGLVALPVAFEASEFNDGPCPIKE